VCGLIPVGNLVGPARSVQRDEIGGTRCVNPQYQRCGIGLAGRTRDVEADRGASATRVHNRVYQRFNSPSRIQAADAGDYQLAAGRCRHETRGEGRGRHVPHDKDVLDPEPTKFIGMALTDGHDRQRATACCTSKDEWLDPGKPARQRSLGSNAAGPLAAADENSTTPTALMSEA
jgi:hypothetical protein